MIFPSSWATTDEVARSAKAPASETKRDFMTLSVAGLGSPALNVSNGTSQGSDSAAHFSLDESGGSGGRRLTFGSSGPIPG